MGGNLSYRGGVGGRGGVSYMLGVMVWVILGHFDGLGRFGSKVMF